jgi:hypothetical protein
LNPHIAEFPSQFPAKLSVRHRPQQFGFSPGPASWSSGNVRFHFEYFRILGKAIVLAILP